MEQKIDFPNFLSEELKKRQVLNDQYSLRAFARDLEINHATLSLVMRNKRSVTKNLLEKLSDKLEINPNEFNYSQNRNITIDISNLSKYSEDIKVIAFDNNIEPEVVEKIIISFIKSNTKHLN